MEVPLSRPNLRNRNASTDPLPMKWQYPFARVAPAVPGPSRPSLYLLRSFPDSSSLMKSACNLERSTDSADTGHTERRSVAEDN